MKKLLSILIIFIFALAGCTPAASNNPDITGENPTTADNVTITEPETPKTAFELYGSNSPDDTLVMLLNNPDADKLSKIHFTETLMLDQTGAEQILIVPRYANTCIQIWSMRFHEGELERDNLIYENRRTDKSFVLSTRVIRTEGAPKYKMLIYSPDAFAEYYFSYNGKDGTPEIEFISAKKLSNADNFVFHEMGYMFTNMEADILSLYGEPSQRETVPLLGDGTGTNLSYGETVFNIDDYTGKVYFAITHDNTIAHPRGVKVGDSMQSVLEKFPDTGSREKINLDGDRSYSLVYGEYMHMQDFGVIEYVADTPVSITYSNENSAVVFELENGKVSKVRYSIPMT